MSWANAVAAVRKKSEIYFMTAGIISGGQCQQSMTIIDVDAARALVRGAFNSHDRRSSSRRLGDLYLGDNPDREN
jgi:hypothetical protein